MTSYNLVDTYQLFWRNLLLASYPKGDDRGGRFIRNMGINLINYTASHPKTLYS
jgi:hypothetical protein